MSEERTSPCNTATPYAWTLWMCLGGLDSPKGMTIDLYNPWCILNVVFHSFLGLILIWWYPLLRLILEKTLELDNLFSMSSKQGIESLYFTMIQLMALLSIHMRHNLSFLWTKRDGTVHGMLSWMYLFLINLLVGDVTIQIPLSWGNKWVDLACLTSARSQCGVVYLLWVANQGVDSHASN
jgi:hypothetical protein